MKSRSFFVIALAALPSIARAGDADCKDAFEKGYAAGKDIEELRTEVKELKGTLSKLIDILGEHPEIAALQEAKDDATRERPPPRGRKKEEAPTFGDIEGKVTFLEGTNVAYVYVDNVGGRLARGRKANIAQRNKQFAPRYLVVQKGTEVVFPNEDAIYHNVFAQNAAATFDLGIYRKGDEAKSYIFTKPGLIDIYCNMHAKMNAEILVVPNHLYTQVRPNGTFKLVRVPEGRRKIVAWGPGAAQVSGWVDVAGGKSASIKLDLTPRDQGSHTNKNGQPYGSYQ